MPEVKIEQAVDISLTNDMVPPVAHVRQFDSGAREIICSLYLDAVLYRLPDDSTVNVTGMRPDGEVFQYGSTTDPDVVSVKDGKVHITVTDFMTSARGKVPVDVTLLGTNSDAIGAFPFLLWVGRAAVNNKALTKASYSGAAAEVAANIARCSINEDGYLVIESEDALGLTFSMDGEGNLTVSYDGKGGKE